MLMNLSRMRECRWIKQMVSYYETYRYDITWGDQDLVNIFFHFYPGANHWCSTCMFNSPVDMKVTGHCAQWSNLQASTAPNFQRILYIRVLLVYSLLKVKT